MPLMRSMKAVRKAKKWSHMVQHVLVFCKLGMGKGRLHNHVGNIQHCVEQNMF